MGLTLAEPTFALTGCSLHGRGQGIWVPSRSIQTTLTRTDSRDNLTETKWQSTCAGTGFKASCSLSFPHLCLLLLMLFFLFLITLVVFNSSYTSESLGGTLQNCDV